MKDKLCTKTHVWIEKNNTSLEKEKRWGELIENRVKEEKEIERIQDFKMHKKEFL